MRHTGPLDLELGSGSDDRVVFWGPNGKIGADVRSKLELATFGITTASFLLALVVSLGGWEVAAEYRPVLVFLAMGCAIAAAVLGGRILLVWLRRRRLARESRLPATEIDFRSGFHGAGGGFVVNVQLSGSAGIVEIRDAASAKFAERIVDFEEIVEWLSRGAPDPISGKQCVPRAAARKFRQGFRRDWIEPQQMADQLIQSDVFLQHDAPRRVKGLTWGR